MEAGNYIGRLLLLAYIGGKKQERSWLAICDCGRIKSVKHYSVISGRCKSCGCFRDESRVSVKTIHGMTRTGEYKSWSEAKQRCHNPKNTKFKWYGARGLTVCDEWRNSFEAFFAHMGPRPENHSLDRIDNSKGYEPGNCRWAPKIVQANNTRFNRKITAFGKTMNMSEWSRESGIKIGTIWARIVIDKLTPEEAVSLPMYAKKKGKTPWNKGLQTTSIQAQEKVQ